MEYKAIAAVWEVTMGCNMRCKHCGSSCEKPLPDELTTEEALKLCDDLGKLGLQWITLSGGEPTTRKDLYKIAQRLTENNIVPTMITNGWLLNEEMIDKAIESGVNTIAFSIDGLEDTHDFIRKKGSFKRSMAAMEMIKHKNINCSAITTINNRNIKELRELKDVLIDKGVRGWQIQLGLPMGNMAKNIDLIAQPFHVDQVIDFAYDAMLEGKIDIQLADCMGYFNLKEIEVRKKSEGSETYGWTGCFAGKNVLGILNNGDITACTSIRDKKFIAGNIKNRPIREIWEDPESFSWNRNMKKEDLEGFCGKCKYGEICKGGCTNSRLTHGESIYSENKYCSYNFAFSRARNQLASVDSAEELYNKADKFHKKGNLQLAQVALELALQKEPDNKKVLNLYGYCSFMLGNYKDSKMANEKLLSFDSNDPCANKGMGLSIARTGEIDKGIEYLKKAVKLSDDEFLDAYYDLAVILEENGRKEEALEVIEKGRKKSPKFEELSKKFYESVGVTTV